MKRSIYEFISKYISYIEKNGRTELSEMAMLASRGNAEAKEITLMIKQLKIENKLAFDNVCKLELDDILYDYLSILKKYYDKKLELDVSIVDISKVSCIPVNSLMRIENLHNIPATARILILLRTLGLSMTIDSD